MNTNTVDFIERQAGIPGLFTRGMIDKYGPQWAARRLLQDIWAGKKPAVIAHTKSDLRELPFSEAARDIAWWRELEAWMIGCYVHAADKNSQYLSADRGMYTGYGEPIHRAETFGWNPIEEKQPGIFRVVGNAGLSVFNGREYPLVIERGQEWVTLDVLKFALKNGYALEIKEGYVFPQYTRVLDEWAARLWTARAALKDIDVEAYRKIKRIATAGNGAWAWNAHDHPGVEWIHPNWWADTVGKARQALLANLLKYRTAPVLIEVDGLYYVSRNPDPMTAILDVDKGVSIFARANECGGFKHQGSFLLTEEIYTQAKEIERESNPRDVPGKMAAMFKGVINATR